MSSTIKSKYKVFESTSPYSKKGRYDEPKEIFKNHSGNEKNLKQKMIFFQ